MNTCSTTRHRRADILNALHSPVLTRRSVVCGSMHLWVAKLSAFATTRLHHRQRRIHTSCQRAGSMLKHTQCRAPLVFEHRDSSGLNGGCATRKVPGWPICNDRQGSQNTTFGDFLRVSAWNIRTSSTMMPEKRHCRKRDSALGPIIKTIARDGTSICHRLTSHPLRGCKQSKIQNQLSNSFGANAHHHVQGPSRSSIAIATRSSGITRRKNLAQSPFLTFFIANKDTCRCM
jgi:hypothetical protein